MNHAIASTAIWLLAYTKPRAEALAAENLLRQGYDCFAPIFMVQKRRRVSWRWLEEPLFPRYVFVGVPETHAWTPIRSTLGVVSLVRFGGRVAAVPDGLITELRALGEERAARRPMFREGQAVRILGDGYSGLEGVFRMQDGEERAQVLVSLLGRSSIVRVPLDELVPA